MRATFLIASRDPSGKLTPVEIAPEGGVTATHVEETAGQWHGGSSMRADKSPLDAGGRMAVIRAIRLGRSSRAPAEYHVRDLVGSAGNPNLQPIKPRSSMFVWLFAGGQDRVKSCNSAGWPLSLSDRRAGDALAT